MIARGWARIALALLAARCAGVCHAQQPVVPQPPASPSEPAATAAIPDGPQISVRVSTSDIRRMEPGKWTLMRVFATNRGSEAGVVFVSGYFQTRSDLQFARRMWIPARSRRETWLPVFTPAEFTGTRAEFISFLLDPHSDVDAMSRKEVDDTLQQSLPVSLDPEPGKIGLIVKQVPYYPTQINTFADPDPPLWAEVAVDANDKANLGVNLFEEFLPPMPEMLEQLDQVILQTDRIADDAAGMIALRHWVERGGRLWIVLNSVSSETVHALLGSALEVREIDRVELESVQFTGHGELADESLDAARTFSPPVEMMRVLTDAAHVTLRVDGWPAAMWTSLGAGEVLLTTVDAAAWVTPRSPDQVATVTRLRSGFPAPVSPWVPTTELRLIAQRWLQAREGDVAAKLDLATPLSEKVGYRIPPRWAILSVLGAFCTVLVGAGWTLAYGGRLEHMAWVAPLAAVPASGLLLAWGLLRQSETPATISTMQVWRSVPQAEEAQISGAAVLYHPEGGPTMIGAEGMGLFQPEMGDLKQTPKRMIWDDMDRWSWSNLALPRGLRPARFETSMATPDVTRAIATFGPRGLEGHLQRGRLESLQDWLLFAPTDIRASVRWNGDQFSIDSSDVLEPGQFLAGAILSDTQRSRAATFEAMSRREVRHSEQPVLLAWSDDLPMSFRLPDGARREGSCLAIIPIELQAPKPGGEVLIPAPWMRYTGSSTVFNQRHGRWLGPVTNASRTRLRCFVPDVVAPLVLSEARLRLRVRAPSRRLSLYMNDVLIDSRDNPIGELSWTVSDENALRLDARGSLSLTVEVGEVIVPEGEVVGADIENSWKIDYVQLEVRGRTAEATP